MYEMFINREWLPRGDIILWQWYSMHVFKKVEKSNNYPLTNRTKKYKNVIRVLSLLRFVKKLKIITLLYALYMTVLMKNLKRVSLFIIYMFSNALIVHAFAMHGAHDVAAHSHHYNTEKETTGSHNNTDCYHDQDTENTKTPSDINHTKCLEQVKEVFASKHHILDESISARVFPRVCATWQERDIVLRNISLHDPWRAKHGNFSLFVEQLYGHGVIMHC